MFLLDSCYDFRCRIDNETGKNRTISDIGTIVLSATERKALAGMHAFPGNDYVFSFSRKGKKKHFWKNVKSNQVFQEIFANFGGANRKFCLCNLWLSSCNLCGSCLQRNRSSHRRCSINNLFLEISRYSQKNTCVEISLKKLQVFMPAILLKRDSNKSVFL